MNAQLQKWANENLPTWAAKIHSIARVARRDRGFLDRVDSATPEQQTSFTIEANHRTYGETLEEVLPTLQKIEVWKHNPTI